MKVLDLCSGTGSSTKAFRDAGHDVVRLELDSGFDAELSMDVREFALDPVGNLRRVRPEGWTPDFIWCSPPCTVFSLAGKRSRWVHLAEPWPEHPRYGRRVPNDAAARLGCQIVEACLDVVDIVKPVFWLMENPRAGLRTMKFMQDRAPEPVTVTYCQYGDTRMKPTDLWGVMPETWNPKAACKNGMPCHESAPRGSKTGTQGLKGAKVRSMVPLRLSQEICAALEAAGMNRAAGSDVQPLTDEQNSAPGGKPGPAAGGGFEHDCRRCSGTGLDPRWTAADGQPEPCDDCGGLGAVVP